ncbi:MAG: glycosyltransferase [Hydrotalea sp.]|nr:glycosyltransferase [Hydrotalea sp.]
MISIVTINLNNKEGLARTINSVKKVQNVDIDYIVIDGDSTDGSKEIIKLNTDIIDSYLIEGDQGVYEAMNKGIRLARGQYILFLNSGDILGANFNNIKSYIDYKYKIIFFDIQYQYAEKLEYVPCMTDINFKTMILGGLPHSGGALINRSTFFDLGFYDVKFKISSDWIWYFKAIVLSNVSYKVIPVPIGVYDSSGISSNPENRDLLFRERKTFVDSIIKGLYDEVWNSKILHQQYQLLKNSRPVKVRDYFFSLISKRI